MQSQSHHSWTPALFLSSGFSLKAEGSKEEKGKVQSTPALSQKTAGAMLNQGFPPLESMRLGNSSVVTESFYPKSIPISKDTLGNHSDF